MSIKIRPGQPIEIHSEINCCPKCKTTNICDVESSTLDICCGCGHNHSTNFACEICKIVWHYCKYGKCILTDWSANYYPSCRHCEQHIKELQEKNIIECYKNACDINDKCCFNDKMKNGWFAYVNKRNLTKKGFDSVFYLCDHCIKQTDISQSMLQKILVIYPDNTPCDNTTFDFIPSPYCYVNDIKKIKLGDREFDTYNDVILCNGLACKCDKHF
jgi:hypothetical protein